MAGQTTRSKLPFPTGTDKVRNGALAIEALAEAVDPGLYIPTALRLSSDLLGAYPAGISYFTLTGAQAAADTGWPAGVSSHVVTFNHGDRGVQYWYRNNSGTATGAEDAWYRQLGTATNSPWTKFAGADYRVQSTTNTGSVSNNTWSNVFTGTVETSAGSIITTSGNGMAVSMAGLYSIDALVQWAGGMTTGAPIIGLAALGASGAEAFYRTQDATTAAGAALCQTGHWQRRMSAGETVGIWVLQASGAAVQVTNRRLAVVRVGN